MRTNFSVEQLADPNLREANAILETCVHYGFCTNTCPTYVLTRDENESPRGRIDLIRAMLERGGAPDPETVRHLDSCLSCLSCMTTCAVKVDYAHLIDRARAHVEAHYKRPLVVRLLRGFLAFTLARPKMFHVLLRLGGIGRRFSFLAPRALRRLLELAPETSAINSHIVSPGIYAAIGSRKGTVALLAGCAQQALHRNINDATIGLLRRHGIDVTVSEQSGCCGSLALHMGKEREARNWAAQNVRAWSREHRARGLDAIVVNASGCGTTVKDYAHLFANDNELVSDARIVSTLARELSEVVVGLELALMGNKFGYRVAYHDPCSIQHGQKIVDLPRTILSRLGFVVCDVPERHFCCGSAGTYNLLQPDMADALGKRKATHIESTAPDIIATGNIGCMMHIARFTKLPVVHWVELADWTTGGKIPPSLAGREFAAPSRAIQPQQDENKATPEVGFW